MEQTKFDNGSVIFPVGEQGSARWFTGTVWVTTLMQPTEDLHYTIGDVKFEAGARTFWHTHPIEQILLCTDGHGFYQVKGESERSLSKGDVVVVPPNVEHWHGATTNSRLTHVAITSYRTGENVKWLNAVTDEEFNEVNQRAVKLLKSKRNYLFSK